MATNCEALGEQHRWKRVPVEEGSSRHVGYVGGIAGCTPIAVECEVCGKSFGEKRLPRLSPFYRAPRQDCEWRGQKHRWKRVPVKYPRSRQIMGYAWKCLDCAKVSGEKPPDASK